jgi:hypothetical protein
VCVSSTYCFCYVHIFLYGLLFKQETEDRETVLRHIIPRLSFMCPAPLMWSEAAYYARVISEVIVLSCRYRETKPNHRQTFPFLAAEKLTPLVSKPTVLKGTDLVPSTSYTASYIELRRMHVNIILSPSCSSKICTIQCCIVRQSKLHAHPVVIRLFS